MSRNPEKPDQYDWSEDFSHENGKYQNNCLCCRKVFMGHKRRLICKNCANPWRINANEKPTDYGKYEVFREGCNKQHYETWNNTGWAYNNNDITHWRLIRSPIDTKPDTTIPVDDISVTLQDVINERKRAMEIARDFMNSYVQRSREKIPGSVQQIIQDELAETSRYIMNAISGRTALNLDTSIDDLVLHDLKNKESS